MDARPTKKKVIWTIVLALLINVAVPLLNWLTTTITWPLVQKYLETNQLEGLFGPANITTLVNYLISPLNIVIFVLELIIIYLFLSLFQKRSHVRMNIRDRR
jgi:hypothetical protein